MQMKYKIAAPRGFTRYSKETVKFSEIKHSPYYVNPGATFIPNIIQVCSAVFAQLSNRHLNQPSTSIQL